ncbi:MAG: hypothetical protein GF372_08025 [Candidatus Marinimicrobia bacterium]|nr:hypothetical protein [Candidatus Neomarinimicrobiota bacterium]
MSHQKYNRISIDPINIRFRVDFRKSSHALNLAIVNARLSPKQEIDHTVSDEIRFQLAYLEYAFLRYLSRRDSQIGFSVGPGISGSAFFADRYFDKTFINTTSLRSYEITYASLEFLAGVYTTIPADIDVGLLLGIPVLSLNTRVYNARVNPLDQTLQLSGAAGQSDLRIELFLRKDYSQFSVELFYQYRYMKYDAPYEKKLLVNRSGLGIYYEF